MRRRTETRRRAALVAVVVLLVGLIAACGTEPEDETDGDPGAAESSAATSAEEPAASPAPDERAVKPPGPLEGKLNGADILINLEDTIADAQVEQIRQLKGIETVERLSVAQIPAQEGAITLAAIDPGSYRHFTPYTSATTQAAWERVAGGEIAIDPELGKRLQDEAGNLRLGNDEESPSVHIGAYAEQIPRVDAVVNRKWGEALGFRPNNALIVSTGMASPQSVRKKLQRITGDKTSVQILGPDLDTDALQQAIPAGGSVGQAVGSFSYSVLGGGRIAPDEKWVAENIRTEEVPILGKVTCHKVMLPQLRAALDEVQRLGLADKINPGEYAGCYYPRFIANSTNLSLHSWGIALDINVPGNQRGTVGELDRGVVAIFKRWGFAWGGDWAWTDPMHFELARLVEAR